ncbi:MAG: kelch repeat-containing protein [Terracidiphilus sp.]
MRKHRLFSVSRPACLLGFAIFAISATAQTTASNEWTWTGGGTDSTVNPPAKRFEASSWTDTSGNFWLFGGHGTDSAGNSGDFNDLWEFVPSSNAWTQISGDKVEGATLAPVYGTLGSPAAANNPGDRDSAVSWTDGSGNLWLFGGTDKSIFFLNDLWEFSPSTKEWTWIGGNDNSTPPANQQGQPGVYGTLGTPAVTNIPGGRLYSISWTDNQGNFWLFGGYGVDSTGIWGYLNDLWEFNPSTNQWAWMGGSSTLTFLTAGTPGVYGTLGTAAAKNIPGGRAQTSGWIDKSGNLWLFGGNGIDANGKLGQLNDLWEYDSATNEWAWISGSNTLATKGGQPGMYGTLGTAAAGNAPGGRQSASSWTDGSGNLWLFGGDGVDGGGNDGLLNDLWEYDPTTNEWAWMDGTSAVPVSCVSSSVCGQPAFYGTLNTPAAWTDPGARQSGNTWTSGGNLFLFGGAGFDGNGNFTYLNDMWEYQPSSTPPTFTAAATPVISLAPGSYTSVQSVTITDATPGASIYYNTTGTNSPSTSSTLYTGAISLSASETIQAIAVAPNYLSSAVASAAYTLTIPPDFALPVTLGSLTISAPESASAQIVVVPLYGIISAPISFSCSGLPTEATCAFSPATVTLAPNSAQDSTILTVTATSPTSAALRRNTNSLFPASALAVVLCCFGSRKRRRLRIFLLSVLSVASVGLFTSCGGGGSGGVGGNNTPLPFTGTITITATSGTGTTALSHTTTFSLTVN